jgi:lysyl-tRNA synthetase class 2
MRLRVERHPLGPRVFFLGVRWHDWHLGLLVVSAVVVGMLSGLVRDGLAAALLGLAGVWLIAKDWRDLTWHRRDTAAWRLGLHRCPHPLRRFRRSDPLPLITAVAAAVIATVDLASALTPNISWRGHFLLRLEGVQELMVFHALAVPVAFVLLISAYYLYRRRLRALRLAVALLLALAIFNLFKGFDYEEALGDTAVAALLWWGRGSFHVEHEPLSRERAFLRAPLVAAAGLAASFALVAFAASHAAVGTLLTETADLLLWRPGPIIFHDELGRLDLAVGLLGIATVAAVAYLLFRPLAAPRDLPDPRARSRARELVQEHGTDTLAYFKLRPDTHYLFTPDERAFLAYRIESGVIVVAGEPVGADEALPQLLAQLVEFAEIRGLRIAAMGVGAKTKPLFEHAGLRGLYLGDEAIVDTHAFTLEGRAIRKVRQSVSRLEKVGYRATLVPIARLSETQLLEIRSCAHLWLDGRSEHGFSMALDPPQSEHCDTFVCLARDADGNLRGLLHFVPTYGRPAASLSIMRRAPDTPNGLTELMIVDSINEFRELGVEEVSLNFAAFARLLHSPRNPLERILRQLLRWADTFFQIERLYRFNAKFAPRWEGRYLMHEGALNLPRTALATLRLEGQLPRPRLPSRLPG